MGYKNADLNTAMWICGKFVTVGIVGTRVAAYSGRVKIQLSGTIGCFGGVIVLWMVGVFSGVFRCSVLFELRR